MFRKQLLPCNSVTDVIDVNILNQSLNASLLACQLPSSGKGLCPAPWQHKWICQFRQRRLPEFSVQSVHTHCAFPALCSASSIPWRLPWFWSLQKYWGNALSPVELQISSRITHPRELLIEVTWDKIQSLSITLQRSISPDPFIHWSSHF